MLHKDSNELPGGSLQKKSPISDVTTGVDTESPSVVTNTEDRDSSDLNQTEGLNTKVKNNINDGHIHDSMSDIDKQGNESVDMLSDSENKNSNMPNFEKTGNENTAKLDNTDTTNNEKNTSSDESEKKHDGNDLLPGFVTHRITDRNNQSIPGKLKNTSSENLDQNNISHPQESENSNSNFIDEKPKTKSIVSGGSNEQKESSASSSKKRINENDGFDSQKSKLPSGQSSDTHKIRKLDNNEKDTRPLSKSIIKQAQPDSNKSKNSKKWMFYGCSNVTTEYKILEKLGEGTFGEVHLGEKISNKYRVALKRIFLHNEKEGFPITALREIRILKALNHPNIIPIVDMAIQRPDRNAPVTKPQRGSVYMITPYMEHDLAGLLGNPGVKLELPHIKCYMYQLFQGMKYLHDQHYLHRDIKSANILIDNWGRLRIADFGLARHYEEPPPRPGTGAGKPGREYTSMVVTRWYRAPELVLGENRYTTAVDMWGVGCVFSEMFRRHPILQGVSDQDQAHCIFKLLGGPTPESMPGYEKLPGGHVSFPYMRTLEEQFKDLDKASLSLLSDLLKLDPQRRLTAVDALSHPFFRIDPRACRPENLPKYKDSHELDARRARKELQPPMPPTNDRQPPPPPSHPPPRARGTGPPPGFLDDAVLPSGMPYGNGHHPPLHQHYNGNGGGRNAHRPYHHQQAYHKNAKHRQNNMHSPNRERGFRNDQQVPTLAYDDDLGAVHPRRGRPNPRGSGGYRDGRANPRYHSNNNKNGDNQYAMSGTQSSSFHSGSYSSDQRSDLPNSDNNGSRRFSIKGTTTILPAANLPPKPTVSVGQNSKDGGNGHGRGGNPMNDYPKKSRNGSFNPDSNKPRLLPSDED